MNPEEIHTKDQLKKIVLEINGSNDYDTIDNLFLPEDEITIYDKFINATSMELICHLTKKISSTSKITIFTGPKKRHTKSIHEITFELNACNPSIIVNCHIASDEFIKRHHDRYIFLGNRMQINFTGGLDSFGLKELSTGKRKNKYSFINIYETNNKPFLTITSKDGISNKVVRYVDK